MDDTDEDAKNRAEMADLRMRGAFLSPFSTFFTILYGVCVVYLLWYFLFLVLPVAVTSVLSIPGAFFAVFLAIVAVFAPGFAIIPIFAIFLLEYFVFGRSLFDLSWVNIFGILVLGIYGVVHTSYAMNMIARVRGDRPMPLFGENPMVKKEILEREMQRHTSGMSAIAMISTTCGLFFSICVFYIGATDPVSRVIPIELILPLITILPIAFTLTSGLRLVYVQSEASVGSAIKWTLIYFSLIIFGFTWVYQGLYPRSGDILCLNVPEYLSSSSFDHSLNSLYFSVVTFTTLGYGDIQPLGWCRVVAASQALCGILFTPLFIAFLFGVIAKQARPK
jgi:hypothetical protein